MERLAPDSTVQKGLAVLLVACTRRPKILKRLVGQPQLVQASSLGVGYPLAKRSQDLRDTVVSVLLGGPCT